MFCNVRLACEHAEERTSRICCRLADDSIALSDLRTRWNGTRLETTCDFRKSWPLRSRRQSGTTRNDRGFFAESIRTSSAAGLRLRYVTLDLFGIGADNGADELAAAIVNVNLRNRVDVVLPHHRRLPLTTSISRSAISGSVLAISSKLGERYLHAGHQSA